MLRDESQPWHAAARKTKSDIPQGDWPAGRETKAGFVVAGLLIALSAWLHAGFTTVPLLSLAALVGGFTAAFLLPTELRMRVESYLFVWGVAGFTAARFALDMNPRNPARAIGEGLGVVPLGGLFELAVSLAAALAAVSFGAALIPLERWFERELATWIGGPVRLIFGGLQRLVYFLGAMVLLTIMLDLTSTATWAYAWPSAGTLGQGARVTLAIFLALGAVRLAGPILMGTVLGLAWLLNPWSGAASAAPHLPALMIEPIYRFAIVAFPILLFMRTAMHWAASPKLPKFAHWISNIEEDDSGGGVRKNEEIDAPERLAPREIPPEAVSDLERSCVRAAHPSWESDREWSSLRECAAASFVGVPEASAIAASAAGRSQGPEIHESVAAELEDHVGDPVQSEEEPSEDPDTAGTENTADAGEEPAPEAATPPAPKQWRLTWRSARLYPAGRPWRLPEGLGLFVGSPVWSSKLGATLFLAATGVVLGVLAAQLIVEALMWLNFIQTYPIAIGPGGIPADLAFLLRSLWALSFLGLVPYLLSSLFVAGRLRSWVDRAGYLAAAKALARMEALARLAATQEVARFALRREYAVVAGQAAQVVEESANAGSEEARRFGQALSEVAEQPRATGIHEPVSAHREIVGSGAYLPGTDASGIYRIYPMYVATLRRLFAGVLDAQVQERFPRMRGEFRHETSDLIRDGVVVALRDRLRTIQRRGLVVGELEEAGRDVGVELAEQLWSDDRVRAASLDALSIGEKDPITQLLSPRQARMLDDASHQFVVLPQPLASTRRQLEAVGVGEVLISGGLEAAAVIRITPFQEGFYDFEGVDSSPGAA